MGIRPVPGGRIATSPYADQCVAKLRVVRRDNGPLSILLLVNFLVIPEIKEELISWRQER